MNELDTDELDEDDPLAYQTYGRSLLALVLLAIIDAHPMKGDRADANSRTKSREKRLEDALQALVGRKPKIGNRTVHDLQALIWMYECYEKEVGSLLKERRKENQHQSTEEPVSLWFDLESAPIEILQIAGAAADKFFPGYTNAKERLYQKYRAQKNNLRELISSFDATEDLILKTARDICALLTRTGLAVEPPKDIWT
jgi:hypothetical protein